MPPLHLFERANILLIYNAVTSQVFKSCTQQPWITARIFGSVSAKKNIMIRMKTIHQNTLKIKYCSPLSHSEISVKQSLMTLLYTISWSHHENM